MRIVGAVYALPNWQLPASAVERIRREVPDASVVHATSDEELVEAIRDADAALLTRLSPEQFACSSRLRWIHSAAAGVGRLLFPALAESDVVLTNSRGIHGVTMAEHVIGVTLALLRSFPAVVRDQTAHHWPFTDLKAIRLLHGRHMVVVGLGAIGSAVAKAASALGMRVSGVRKHPEALLPDGVQTVKGPDGLLALLREADVVVLAAPLTSETRALIGRRELTVMKPTALLVNVARGKLVDQRALETALAGGAIGGAALDVVEHEPLGPASPLWDMPNVLITPHTAGFREDYWDAVVDIFVENARRLAAGQPLLNVVDKGAGY